MGTYLKIKIDDKIRNIRFSDGMTGIGSREFWLDGVAQFGTCLCETSYFNTDVNHKLEYKQWRDTPWDKCWFLEVDDDRFKKVMDLLDLVEETDERYELEDRLITFINDNIQENMTEIFINCEDMITSSTGFMKFGDKLQESEVEG